MSSLLRNSTLETVFRPFPRVTAVQIGGVLPVLFRYRLGAPEQCPLTFLLKEFRPFFLGDQHLEFSLSFFFSDYSIGRF